MAAVLGIAILVGAIAGLATGGRFAQLGSAHLRAIPLLVIGAVVQVLVLGRVITASTPIVVLLLVATYAALAGFAIANLGRGGMGVILAGIILNAIPIALNSGMPVEATAIVRARIAKPTDLPLLDFGAKRHLAAAGDHLRILDDRFPEWVTHHVLSIGDLVIAVGVGAVTAGLLHPGTGRRRGRAHARRRHPSAGPDPRTHATHAAHRAHATPEPARS